MTDDVQTFIQEKLDETESTENVRILFAAESGSRAWGFASPDSDFDVRFFYAHPSERYLSLWEGRDVIDFTSADCLFDLGGWDLRKAIRLALKGNATVLEWLQSPIVYRRRGSFGEDFLALLAPQYPLKSGLHHYVGTARTCLADVSGEAPKLKRLFYGLRASLAARWIADRRAIPPMELAPLRDVIDSAGELNDAIEALLPLKKAADESTTLPAHAAEAAQTIIEFLRTTVAIGDAATQTLPDPAVDRQTVDRFFQTIVGALS